MKGDSMDQKPESFHDYKPANVFYDKNGKREGVPFGAKIGWWGIALLTLSNAAVVFAAWFYSRGMIGVLPENVALLQAVKSHSDTGYLYVVSLFNGIAAYYFRKETTRDGGAIWIISISVFMLLLFVVCRIMMSSMSS